MSRALYVAEESAVMAKAIPIEVVLATLDESPISIVLATVDVVPAVIVTQVGAGVLTAPATAQMVEIESPALTAAVEIGATAISTWAMVIATGGIVTAVGADGRVVSSAKATTATGPA